MANQQIAAFGALFLIIAAIGYFWETNTGFTYPQVNEYCNSDLGKLAQYWGDRDIRRNCNTFQMITFGIYGAGIIGIILIIVGAIYTTKKSIYLCDHCKFAASTEAELYNHSVKEHKDDEFTKGKGGYTKV